MATTSPDNIRTPDPGDPFNLVPDLATLANDVQDALSERANSYRGTASERLLFTSAPDGTLWADTDAGGDVWRADSGGWINLAEDVQEATVPFSSPYSNYSSSQGLGVKIVKVHGVVTVSGAASVSNSSNVDTGNDLAVLPGWAAPSVQRGLGIFQGSGDSVWHLTAKTASGGGTLIGERYRPSSAGTNLWLPFSASYAVDD